MGMDEVSEGLSEMSGEDESVDLGSSYGRLAPPKDPSQVYSVRIPVSRIEELRRVASGKGLAPSTLLREWVLERLDLEAPSRSQGEVDVWFGTRLSRNVMEANVTSSLLQGQLVGSIR